MSKKAFYALKEEQIIEAEEEKIQAAPNASVEQYYQLEESKFSGTE